MYTRARPSRRGGDWRLRRLFSDSGIAPQALGIAQNGLGNGAPTRGALGNDVRRQLVLEPDELVAQQELALLEPLQLQLVGLPGIAQRFDRRVEVAVLLAQPLDVSDEGGAFLRREPLVNHLCVTLPTAQAPRLTPRRPNYGCAAGLVQGARESAPCSHNSGVVTIGKALAFPAPRPKCRAKAARFCTARRHFAACVIRQLCHNFVVVNIRELSHVD
jgi:hypothetical protein